MTGRRIIRVLALAALAFPAFGQGGAPDLAFKDIPFEQWFHGGEQTRMRWSASVSPVRLDSFQRWRAEILSRLDGVELKRRIGHGEMRLFAEVRDSANNLWQTHSGYDLTTAKQEIGAQWADWTLPAWFLPGDYRVFIAVYDTATREHAVREAKLHVPQFRADPLPDAWRGLPAVEFIPPEQPPDSWFLPTVASRLHLSVKPRRPVQVELIVNLDAARWSSRAGEKLHDNLSVLFPELKVISQIDLENASLNVTLLDLERRRVVYQQKDVRTLDWEGIRNALKEDDSHTIDVRTLANGRSAGQFFASEIGRRVYDGPPRAVIVLSGPITLEHEDVHAIELTPPKDACVFYVRNSFAVSPLAEDTGERRMEGFGRGRMGGRGRRGWDRPAELPDQLEPTLRPLAPRLFDVSSPEQFRKALAGIVDGLSTF